MTRFRISLAILLVLLGISMGSMAAVRHSGNAVLEAVQQVSETASPTAAQCEAVVYRHNHIHIRNNGIWNDIFMISWYSTNSTRDINICIN